VHFHRSSLRPQHCLYRIITAVFCLDRSQNLLNTLILSLGPAQPVLKLGFVYPRTALAGNKTLPVRFRSAGAVLNHVLAVSQDVLASTYGGVSQTSEIILGFCAVRTGESKMNDSCVDMCVTDGKTRACMRTPFGRLSFPRIVCTSVVGLRCSSGSPRLQPRPQ
jgi:hypothetical protein